MIGPSLSGMAPHTHTLSLYLYFSLSHTLMLALSLSFTHAQSYTHYTRSFSLSYTCTQTNYPITWTKVVFSQSFTESPFVLTLPLLSKPTDLNGHTILFLRSVSVSSVRALFKWIRWKLIQIFLWENFVKASLHDKQN